MADLFDQESPESLGWKVPEPKPRKSILGGYSGRLSRPRITQDMIGEAVEPEASTPTDTRDEPWTDLGKMLAGGTVKGAGATVRGAGEAVVDPLKPVENVSLLFRLARGIGLLPKPAADTANPLEEPAAALEQAGKRIEDSVSPPTKEAIRKSQPDGDITDPASWTLGEDPSLRGYAMQGADVFGSMLPVVVASLLTRRAGQGAQVAAPAMAGGAQGGGAAASQVRSMLDEMSDEQLKAQSPRYRALLAEGGDPAAARATLTREAERWAYEATYPVSAAGGMATGAIIGKPGEKLVERIGSRAGRAAALGAVSGLEEGTQETAEGVQTMRGLNAATGMDVPVTQGSVQNFVLGAMGGGVTGGVRGAFTSPEEKGAAPAEDEVGDGGGPGAPVGERATPADWEVVDDLPATTPPGRGPGPEFSGFDRQLGRGQPTLPAPGEAPGGPGPGGPTAGGGGPGAFIQGPTQEQMAQRSASPDVLAAQRRGVMPTDILSRFGTPFLLRSSAEAEAERTGGQVVEVDDGFVVRPETSDVAAGRDGIAVGPAVGADVPQPVAGPAGRMDSAPAAGRRGDGDGVLPDAAGLAGGADAGVRAAHAPDVGGVRPRGGAAAVAPKPRRTREQVAADRKRAYRDANPFRAFLGEFGVHTSERSDAGGDPRRPVMVPYHGALFRNSGMHLDELALRAVEAGFLTQADIDSEFDNGGVNKLADMIRRDLAGERIMPIAQAEDTEEARWREQSESYWEAMNEAEDAVAALTDDEINALLQIASDEDAEVSNEEIDLALEPGDAQEGGAGAQEGAAGPETGGDSAGGAAARDQGSAEVGFGLTAPTPDQFRREAADAEAQARREGAPPPEDFTLTGSNRTVDQTAARGQMELAPAPETATTFQWKPLAEGERANDRWEGSMRRGFEPNAYQQSIMDAVRAALDAGKFYSDEVKDFAAERLGITPEQRALNKTRVEGGDFGYEVYLARNAVEARSKDAKLQEATRELNLKPGDKLGTLVFNNDFKRNTGMTVVSVDGDAVVLEGKRGAQAIRQTTDSLGVKAGIDRAKEKGYRPDSADEFIARRKRVPSLAQRAEAALTEKKAESEQSRRGIGRDGRTEADRADATLRSSAAELAGQFAAEVKEDDFDPAEVRPALEAWAKQANVPADDLRQEVLKRIADNDGLSASHKKRIADALSPTKAAAQAEKPAARITRDSDLADGTTIYDGQGKPYRVHYQRNDLVVAHPIVDGKAQVSADTSVRFWVNPDRPASGENDRTDPIYTAPQGTLVSRANAALKGKIEDVGEKIGGARKDLSTPTGRRAAKAEDEAPGWRKRYEVSQITKSTKPAEEGRWVIYDKRQKDRLGQPKQVGRDTFPTKEAAEAAIPLAEVARNHRVTLASTKKGAPDAYEITRMVTDRKRVKVVDQQFPTRADAMRYMVEHAVEIIETKTSFGEEILPAPDTVRRTGPVRRQGDATAEQFKDTFGFRAVEFGNWNSQEERQEVMNHAFDGLADLAEVLGIPTRAIGLNGDLALAFGARGSGLTGARAHYEPDYSVINLTKMRGAGSLAHEWLHALDHYLGRQDGKASSERVKNNRGDTVFKTHSPEGDMASHGFKYRDSGVRPEVREAYAALIETMYRKAEQFVEDTQAADRFVGKAREDVQKHLGRIRENLATKITYRTRKNAPASAEQLAAFDEIARKIVDGEAIETTVMPAGKSGVRWSNDALEALSRIIKDVRGHSGFLATRDGTLDRLRAEMEHYSQRLKMLAQAQSAEVKTKKVPTDYAMAAKSIDQGRASDYWSTQHEMAARAFQSYVLDKIAERGNTSDFLTYGAENLVVPTPWGWQRPFPAGDERKAINAAFDKLVATLQTRETDKGVMLFSRRRVTLPDATIGATLGDAARHPDYAAAKAGDPAAAARLVRDLVTDEFVEKVRKAIGEAKPIIQPMLSVEESGRNKIPLALAELFASRLGLESNHEIVQATVVRRTLLGGLARLLSSPEFVGQVRQGADYLLVDDTLTQGGTFAALAGFVEDGGGRVIGAVALTGKQYSAKLTLSDALLEQVREKFGDIEDAFRAATGHGFDALTESEARYLVKHDAPDTIRDRILAAREQGSGEGHPLRSGRLDHTDIAAHAAATSPLNDHPEPTEAQKDAGNYPKGHLRIAGIGISIENPAGSHRRPEWPAMPAHYGYIRSLRVPRDGLVQSRVAHAEILRNLPQAISSGPQARDLSEVVDVLLARVFAHEPSAAEGLRQSALRDADFAGDRRAAEAFATEIQRLLKIPSGRSGGHIDSLVKQAAADGVSADAYLLGNAGDALAVRSHGFNRLDIDRKAVVQSHVFAALKDDEVRRSVVRLLSVDVMDMLGRAQGATDGLLGDQAVLLERLAIPAALDDAVFVRQLVDAIAARLPVAFAARVAEEARAPGKTPIVTENGGSAPRADNSSHSRYVSTIGADGDHVDVFVREGTPEDFDGPVFVIDQVKADGSFDEHKVMLGWRTQVGAARAYRAAFTKGWKGLGAITRASMDAFKGWLASGRTKRPFAGRVDAGRGADQDVSRETVPPSHREAVDDLRARLRAAAGGNPNLEHGLDGLRAARVPDALAAHAARALGEMFGVDVVFVDGAEKLASDFQFDGFYAGGRRVFVSTISTKPFHQTVGHEFLHNLKRSNPELYDEFVDAVRPYMNARAANAYAAERAGDPIFSGMSEAVRSEAGWEETFADTWGDAWNDPAFWRSLAARERSLFRRIVAKWKAFVLRIRMALARDRGSPLVKGLFSDFDAVRDVIVDITARAASSAAGEADAAGLMRSANRNPVFYSELERQIDAINARAQPAQSWVQQIDSLTKKGVKPDEIEWSGVKEWLALQQGKVTKDAILEYLAGNGVRVEETILGDRETEDALLEREARRLMREDGIENPTDEQVAEFIEEHGYDIDNVRDWQFAGQTKFGTYRVPGQAENYRELLLTLPQKVIEPDAANNARIAEGRKAVFDHYEPQIADLDRRIDVARDAGSRGEYNRLWEQRNSLIDERDATAARKAGVIQKSRIEPVKFQSNDWNQPNVLAHVRIDERTDADGKRVLFVNEMQSDWAQRGRKHGFRTGNEAPNFQQFAEREGLSEAEWRRIWDNQNDLHGADLDLWRRWRAEADRFAEGLPRGPFVEKTDAWVALALKRIIRYAVDNGFDRVAIASGEQAADMFDLGSQIDSLGWRANGDGTVRITGGYSRDGAVSNRTFGDFPVEKLPEVVGKDLAEKIRTAIAGGAEANKDDVALLARHGIKHRPDVADYAFETPEGLLTAEEFSDNGVKAGPDVVAAAKRIQAASAKNGGTFSGLDLRVGDHGMRGFYDQIVPKVLKDVLKKLGGDGPKKLGIPAEITVPEARRRGIEVRTDRALEAVNEQLGFDITPALRERAARGMPMFSRRRAAATTPPPSDPRVGPIDTLLRGVGGKALSEKFLQPNYDRLIRAARRAIPEAVKQGLVSDYGLDEPYMDVRDATRAEINKQLRGAKSIIDLLAGLDREQSRVAYQWMTERPDAATERAMMDALPEDSRAVMARMKEMVHELGRAAVRAGLLSEDAFQRNEYAYLHRSYTKHEAESAGADGVHWKARAKIRAETFKGRGLRHDIDQDRLMRYADEVTAGDKFTRFERRRADGKLAEVRYVPVGKPMPPELAGWRNDGVWEARWMGKPTATKVGMYRDFTKAERERMGEIEEVRYAFAKTVLHAVKDIEHAKFLRWVANEYGRDPEALEAGGETVHDGKSGYINLRTYAPDEWVKVPSTKIPGTNLRAYGELAGKAVPAAIWNDIRSTFGSRPETLPGKVYDWTLRAWKLSKTAMSPAVHTNNVMANVILADLADIRVTDMVEAFRVLRAAKQGDAAAKALIARYEDSGAEQGSLVAQELRLEAIEPMLADLLQEADHDLGMVKVSQLLSMAAHGDVAAALRGLKSKRAVKAAAIPFKKLIDAYHMEDSVFRLAAFLRHTKDGMSDLKAGQVARDAFLNYDINAPWINALRRGPLPFIAFSYRVIPLLVKGLVYKPWKWVKYAGIASVLGSASYMMLGLGGDDERRERALLPEEKSGRVFGIFPRLMRMPWNDEHGAPVFLDVRRWLPAGDVFDVQQSQSTVPLPGWLTASGPLGLFMELMLNKSSFTGNPIVLETDTTGEAMAKVADHLFKFMTPNLPIPNPLGWVADRSMAVPGLWQTYSFTSLQNAGSGVTDAFGRERSLGQAAAASVGVKLGSYPSDVMQMHEGIRYRQNADEIRKQVRSIMRQQSRGALDPDEAQTKIEAQREKLRRINERLREKLEAAR